MDGLVALRALSPFFLVGVVGKDDPVVVRVHESGSQSDSRNRSFQSHIAVPVAKGRPSASMFRSFR